MRSFHPSSPQAPRRLPDSCPRPLHGCGERFISVTQPGLCGSVHFSCSVCSLCSDLAGSVDLSFWSRILSSVFLILLPNTLLFKKINCYCIFSSIISMFFCDSWSSAGISLLLHLFQGVLQLRSGASPQGALWSPRWVQLRTGASPPRVQLRTGASLQGAPRSPRQSPCAPPTSAPPSVG